MFIKVTLFGLILILFVVIAASYYGSKEAFDDISNGYFSTITGDLQSAMNTVSTDVSSAIDTASSDVSSAMNTVSNDISNVMNDTTNANGYGNDSVPAPFPVMSGVSPAQAGMGSSVTPQRIDVTPQVTISGTGYDAMTLQQKSDLISDIQKVVKNETLANRRMDPLITAQTFDLSDTDSTQQGKEYMNGCDKEPDYRCPKNPDGSCPPIPDMTQYIKKDAIPCWGCSLDY
jgi:hypothetical protein